MVNGVLIVDDAAFMRLMLREVLQSADIPVAGEAATGDEGIFKYKSLNPDIVILDLTMPGTDGLNVLRILKSMNKDARVIICSSMGQKEIVKEAIKLGADAFIVKPFHANKVIETVQLVYSKSDV
ncbi:MAG TPA: two-component system response regulator [Ruminococcaceae bacterium]|nr:two-component system response regulator [Oscillospiraceae bacterium]